MKNYPDHAYPSRRAFLRKKRHDGKVLLRALDEFRNGCAYLPPSENQDSALLISKLETYIKGPCREAWRKA